MAQIIEAPNEVNIGKPFKKLFLAGGITSCPNWQLELIEKLKDVSNLVIFNPRRENFPIENPNAAIEQITWEYKYLKEADIISFWFSKGSLNPIVLYELGMWRNSNNLPVVVGMVNGYERRQD
jgi:hypothetical protein